MEILQNIEQIQVLIAELRNLRKGYITNFYIDNFKHQIWIGNGDFKFEQIGETLFLFRFSDNFCNLFYCTTTIEELEFAFIQLEKKYPELVKMVDIVGAEIQCMPIKKMLEKIGYYTYRQLVRMSKLTPSENTEIINQNVYFATLKDSKIIRQLLLQNFDARCEQIPYQEELDEYVKNKHILVYKESGVILGFVIFESNRTTNYLRYWFVHPNHRDKKIGSVLLNSFFYEGRQTRRQLFWVITDNENAIKRYRHYGFIEENLFDFVMSNK